MLVLTYKLVLVDVTMTQPLGIQKVKALFNLKWLDTPPDVPPVTLLQIINESKEVCATLGLFKQEEILQLYIFCSITYMYT